MVLQRISVSIILIYKLNDTLKIYTNYKVYILAMTTVLVRRKRGEQLLKINGIQAKLYDANDRNENSDYPADTVPLGSQVAGHSFGDGKSTVGMLKHKDGHILKPITKPKLGDREIKFYEDLRNTTDSVSLELKTFVPDYLGSVTLTVSGEDVKFIKLEDVTKDFAEPCIMDVKIGRQTWDPEATKEKIHGEKQKYVESKRDLGFCIPGFQLYRLTTGEVIKMGKEYGKKLTKHSVRDALKLFLNADCGLNRLLVLQLLAKLWRILRWCRTQKKYRMYSSSLLLVYDARKLRQCVKIENCSPFTPISPIPRQTFNYKSLSLQGLGSLMNSDLSLDRLSSRSSSAVSSPSSPRSPNSFDRQLEYDSSSWHVGFQTACKTHSLINNYDKDLQSKRENYKFDLENLISADKPCSKDLWANVRMIDFAHVFPAPSEEVDANYLEGIENLVKVFESLMEEVLL